MRAGFASVDITPPVGTPIAGNVREDNLTHGVYHEIFSHSVCLHDGETYLSLTSLDLCGISAEQVNEIRRRVSESTELENITIGAVHTHSGPTTGILQHHLAEKSLIESIIASTSKSIIDAYNSMQDVTIRFGHGKNADLPNNRRVWTNDGKLHMNWEKFDPDSLDRPAGPIDPELLVLSFQNGEGEIVGILVNYTLHPAVLAGDNNLTSADFVGFLQRHLSDNYSSTPEVLFFNGTQGNINHLNPWNPDQVRGFEEAERIGTTLARDVIKVISNSKEIETLSIKTARRIIEIPRRTITPEKIAWAKDILDKWDGKPISLVDGVPDETYAQATMQLAEVQDEPVITEIQITSIGPINIVTLPGEFFVEYGLRIKKLLGQGNTMVFGLTNGYVGYVPTLEAFEEGGYEASNSLFGPEAGNIIVKETISLISKDLN